MQSNVFILYTGGTFGMKETTNGLEPSSWEEIINYLPAIKNQSYFDFFNEITFSYDVLEPVLDSSSMNPDSWKKIAKKIKENYDNYDGFIIIHGTDTLAYTASALSFMLTNSPSILLSSLNGKGLSLFNEYLPIILVLLSFELKFIVISELIKDK